MTIKTDPTALRVAPTDESRDQILDAFRHWGYLQADLDPLGRIGPVPVAVLDAAEERGTFARRFYCGAVGVEFMHMPDPTSGVGSKREWNRKRRLEMH